MRLSEEGRGASVTATGLNATRRSECHQISVTTIATRSRRSSAIPRVGNIDWRQVIFLLDVVGTVVEEHNGNVKVTLGAETEVFHPLRGKDIYVQMVVDL